MEISHYRRVARKVLGELATLTSRGITAIDHIDRDIFNNDIKNLRIVNYSANRLNHGLRNILFIKRFNCKPYEPHFSGTYLGRFNSLKEAFEVYDEYHIKIFVAELSKTRHLNPHLLDGEYYHYWPPVNTEYRSGVGREEAA